MKGLEMEREISPKEWEQMAKICQKDGGKYFYTKGNLPGSLEAYRRGNGEGIFIMVDLQTNNKLNKDQTSGTFFGFSANDSIYYPSLNEEAFGETSKAIEFEFRGTKRPVLVKSKLLQLMKRKDCSVFFFLKKQISFIGSVVIPTCNKIEV